MSVRNTSWFWGWNRASSVGIGSVFFVCKPTGRGHTGETAGIMEPAKVVRFLSRSMAALLMPSGGVITAILSDPIDGDVFDWACAYASPECPMAVEVKLGEYVTDRFAFTECSLRLPEASGGQRLTKFRRVEWI